MKILSPMTEAQDAVSKEYVDGLLGSGGGGSEVDTSTLATKAELEEAEEVTAAALNDLKSKQEDFEKIVHSDYVLVKTLVSEIARLTQIIIDNEEVTAAALTDLDKRL